MSKADLAVNGGAKTITHELKGRFQFDEKEKNAVMALFDESIKTGNAFGYNGPQEEAFGKEFAAMLGGGYADGVNGGTNAVFVALRALHLPPFSEVIVGCVTDPGGMMPIVVNDCIPVVADCTGDSYNTSLEQIKPLVTERTRAVVVAHIGGEPVDIEPIAEFCKEKNLYLIEDCAQSHAAKINGRNVGTFGTAGAFSLMFGKHMCTGGQGGAVFTKDEDMYWRIRRAADRGKPFNRPAGSTNDRPAINCNMDELHAAIGRVQIPKLKTIVANRQKFVELLKSKGMGNLKAIKIPQLKPGFEHCYWWWRLTVNIDALNCTKEEYCAALAAEGVQIVANYSAALPARMEWFQNRAEKFPWNNPCYKGDPNWQFPCPNATRAMKENFILFINESWGEEEAELIMKAFKKVDAELTK